MKLTPEEQTRWLGHLGSRATWCVDRTLLPVYVDAWENLTVDSSTTYALYLVVDADDEVLYVGKVGRAQGSVADRFRGHHAYEPEWARVWVIPLVTGVAAEDAADCEHTLIQYFDPVDNTRGRAGRETW